jgi:mRNA-degrading endonuclease RelE of RelBE toxin-antitoxin system
MPYVVEIDTKAAKEIRDLPRRDQEKIISKADRVSARYPISPQTLFP